MSTPPTAPGSPLSACARSILFVPADRPDRYSKALNSGADMVCVDLEDALAPSAREAARDQVPAFFSGTPPPQTRRALRINALSTMDGLRDMLWLANSEARPDLLLLPKTATARDVAALDHLLTETGLPCPVLAIIESAEGMENAAAIALHPRVAGICFGSADYTAETCGTMGWDSLAYGRGHVVQAAARAGKPAIDGAWLDIKDENGLLAESRRLFSMGFSGRIAIHPAQVPAIHQAFSPSVEDAALADRILAAASSGQAGAIRVDGRMVDRPVIAWAQRTALLASRGGP